MTITESLTDSVAEASVPERTDVSAALALSIGRRAQQLGVRVAVAESLTGGMVSAALAKSVDAAQWYAGAIVAYGSDIKHALLGVPSGSVVCPEAALAMASAVSRLLDAEYAISLTGAGGPDPQDGMAPGTVFVGVAVPSGCSERRLDFDGDPVHVCRQAAWSALAALDHALERAQSNAP
ncbi:MAG: CinA family protein [Sporichthyaceae bacterium]